MATSFDVNLGIESRIGFRRPGGAVKAPLPIMQTTRTLNGEVIADSGITNQTKVLFISPIETFDNIRAGTTSTVHPVTLTNYGNTALMVTATYFSANGATPVFDLTPDTPGQVETLGDGEGNFIYGYYSPIVVPANGEVTFGLSYRGDQVGEWSNGILFIAETDLQIYKSTTRQIVTNIYEFSIDPPEVSRTFNLLDGGFVQTFNIIPYQGVTELINSIDIDTELAAFTVLEYSTSSFTVKFDPNRVGNANGIYTATITVSASGGSIPRTDTATMTAVVNVPVGAYQGVSANSFWIGPGSYDNSIVGVSYDKIGGRRTITIGVGSGGIGVPEYTSGGKPYASPQNIGRYAAISDVPYPGWANAYRIPVNEDGDTTPRVYYSKEFQVKTGTVDYGSYFGDYESEGSMFLVHDDGAGNIRIELTHLRLLSGNESVDRTLKNLTRSLHYYSTVDDPNRFPNNSLGNLESSPTNAFGDFVQDGQYTHLFLGFLKNGRVVASIVDLPKIT
jgi:hypothetical protein